MATPYVYESLSGDRDPDGADIRLLHLLPGDGSSPVQCELIRTPLKQCPSFEALSYVWGSPGKTVEIQLHGSVFSATANLEAALRHLRYANRPRCLWVDAVCINQGDNDEKSRQVVLMPDIYSSAIQVLFWLGEGDKQSDETCAILTDWYHHAKRKRNEEARRRKTRPSELDNPGMTAENRGVLESEEAGGVLGEDASNGSTLAPDRASADAVDDSAAATDLDHIARVFTRSWWTRLWVVQEGAYARGGWFVVGHSTVPFDPEVLHSALLERVPVSNHDARTRLQQLVRPLLTLNEVSLMRAAGVGNVRRNFLQETIEAMAHRDCSNPRDRIYAILSLLRLYGLHELVPDYSQPVWRVFRDATRAMIRHSNRLDCLLASQPPERLAERQPADREPDPTRRIPSWVPDWHAKPTSPHPIEAPFWGMTKLSLPLYSADGGRGARWRHGASAGGAGIFVDGDDDVLRLRGLDLDRVAETTPKATGEVPGAERQALRRFFWGRGDGRGHFPRYFAGTGEDAFDAFWVTLIRCVPMNNPFNSWDPRLGTAKFQKYRLMLRRWLGAGDEQQQDEEPGAAGSVARPREDGGGAPGVDSVNDDETEALLQYIERCWKGWTFCTSEKGFYALVHGDVLPGDSIFLVDGANMPLVLRPDTLVASASRAAAEGLRCFSKVGFAYVHGVMYHGEGRKYRRPLQEREPFFLI